ncbi:peptide/nickel transport system ATP-binding protein [Cricetibacter osteomyelitidis]|uniref:Peptide/nickel transport system ATP-binding protein n=1 Tax=Cricetibacter osteomyelitidis TaxID=1521931 RepID=A0A4R2TDT7_9PAST|nr:ATP-binding cassette domain-containing protein [Cricetibacter osteomyelitidis]TCP95318.1 peptide/nickel transport system ATP-binding protein [Cricetibacter osteomyelitidis]
MDMIQVTDLSVKTKSGLTLVEPINLRLQQGRNLTILGETGSGKSLLAQAIMGALPDGLIFEGDVKIHGETPEKMAPYWGKQLAMLPQEPVRSLDPTMTILNQVWESLYFVAKQPEKAEEKSQQKLAALGLGKFIDYYPHQLSGGMAQRVAFAVATSGGAKIVIADEPTKGLDSISKGVVIRMLQLVAEQCGTLLTITHDIEVAEQLGGNMMVMKKGKLLEQGDTEQILQAPRSDYAKALIAAMPKYWEKADKKPLQQDVLLTVTDLGLNRGKRVLFEKMNFELKQGEVIGIVGDSGIGKSSLGDALCGLLKPKCGKISWKFQPKRHQVLKLYQDPPAAFAPNIKLQTLLDDVINKHKLDRSRIPYLLEQLKLTPDLLQRSAENVSGGELQRIAILRALLFNPVLLFADEVTSRLDPITQKETLDLLTEQCHQHHCSLVIVSHDHDLIEHYCHQVIDLGKHVIAWNGKN